MAIGERTAPGTTPPPEEAVRANETSAPAERRKSTAGRAFTDAAILLVVTRAVFLVVAYMAAWYLASGTGPLTTGFFEIWDRWDGSLFLKIAEHGYFSPAEGNSAAFFPGYIIAIRSLSWLPVAPVVVGMLVSAVASLIAFYYLIRLGDHELGEGRGRDAALFLALFPTAVFLVAPYSEALFLAGTIAAFFYARTGAWMAAAPWVAVATATRAAGVFVMAGLAVELIRQKPWKDKGLLLRGAAALVAGLLPLIAYGLFLRAKTGDPLFFFEAQRAGWGRSFTDPLAAFKRTWETWNGGNPTNWIFAWRIEIMAAIMGLAAVLWAVTKRHFGYAVFMGLTLASLVTSTWYFSIPRIMLSFFPVAIYAAAVTAESQRRRDAVVFLSGALAIMGTIVYTRGAWFY